MSQRQQDAAEDFTSSPDRFNIDSIPPIRPSSQPPGNNAPFRAAQREQNTLNQYNPPGFSAHQKRPVESGYSEARPRENNTANVAPTQRPESHALNLHKRRSTQSEPFGTNIQLPFQTGHNPQANIQTRGNPQNTSEQSRTPTGYEHLFIHISELALVDPELVELIEESPRSPGSKETQSPRAQSNFNRRDQTRQGGRIGQVQSVKDTSGPNFKIWQDKDGTTYYYSEEWYQNEDAIGHIRTRIREQQSSHTMPSKSRQTQPDQTTRHNTQQTQSRQNHMESSRQVQFERPGQQIFSQTVNVPSQSNSTRRNTQSNIASIHPESTYQGNLPVIIHDCPGCDLADYRIAQEHLAQATFERNLHTNEYNSAIPRAEDLLRHNVATPSQQGHFVESSGQRQIRGSSEQAQNRTIPSDPGQFRTTTSDAYGRPSRSVFNGAGSRGQQSFIEGPPNAYGGPRSHQRFIESPPGHGQIMCPECQSNYYSGHGNIGVSSGQSGFGAPGGRQEHIFGDPSSYNAHQDTQGPLDYSGPGNIGVSPGQSGFVNPGGQLGISGGPSSYNAQGPAQSQFEGQPSYNTGTLTQQGTVRGRSGEEVPDLFRTTTGDAYGYGA